MGHWFAPAALSFVCWGLWAFLPKLTTRYLDPRSALVYEVLGTMLVAVVVLFSLGGRPAVDPRGIGLAVLTGVVGVIGALGYLFAVVRGPVTLISTVTALYPVLAVLLAALILHEPVSLRQGLGILLALVAIVLIADG